MSPSRAAQAAAAVAFVGAVGAIVAHDRSPSVSNDKHHVAVGWGILGAPPGLRCYTVSALASRQALAIFGGVTAGDAGLGAEYVRVRVAYVVLGDAGTPALPSGMDPVDATAEDGDCPSDVPQVEGWVQQAGSIEPCACAVPNSGARVLADADGGTAPAPIGVTVRAGQWITDAGVWVPKTCVELAGAPSMPSECAP